MIANELIKKTEYDFLRMNPDLKNVIYLTLSGSHGYGTNNENSDADLRGVLIEDIDYGLDYLLWNGEETRYEYSAVFADGDWIVSEFDGRNFYPDAVSQLMPILTGVIDVDSIRAEALYQLFSETFDWQELEHMSGGHDEFYWGLIAYTAALMGDTARLDSYLESVAREGWGHSTSFGAMDLAMRAGVGCFFLFHHDPEHSDAKLFDNLDKTRAYQAMMSDRGPMRIELASEGLTLDI